MGYRPIGTEIDYKLTCETNAKARDIGGFGSGLDYKGKKKALRKLINGYFKEVLK